MADRNLNTLVDYRYTRTFIAKRGENGGGADQYGKGGDDIILRMPVGTVISDSIPAKIADLDEDGKKVRCWPKAAKAASATSISSPRPTARRANAPRARKASEYELQLELKVLADVGLLGMPNAGKSTLIRAVSAARPKVGDYPFTTLHPNLGVVRVDENRSFVIADIPGLIEGAADGAGLGTSSCATCSAPACCCIWSISHPSTRMPTRFKDAKAIVEELRKHDPAWRQTALAGPQQARPDPGRGASRAHRSLPLEAYGPVDRHFEISALKARVRPLVFAIQDHRRRGARTRLATEQKPDAPPKRRAAAQAEPTPDPETDAAPRGTTSVRPFRPTAASDAT
jgi:GTPase